MDKKVASEFAIGVVLMLAIIIGGTFWMYERKQVEQNLQLTEALESQQAAVNKANNNSIEEKTEKTAAVSPASDLCKSHYYGGESRVRGWVVPADQDKEGGVIVRIVKEDIQKLPIKNTNLSGNFTVRLIDATIQIKNSLSRATENKPVTITLKGYAEICEKQPPQVSLEQASVVFKKANFGSSKAII